MSGYWFPICDHCDEDAVSLAPPSENTWWRFACPRHTRTDYRPIRDVELGWRPITQDASWNAALTAIRGVKKPARDWQPDQPSAPAPRRHLALVPPAPAWPPHDAIPQQHAQAHWADDIPLPDEPPEEEWR